MAKVGPTILRPRTIREAVSMSVDPDTCFAAGATALQVDWSKGVARPKQLIDLSWVDSVFGLVETPETLSIGALTTLAAAATDPITIIRMPCLRETIRNIAAPAIRARGTIGGNIGWKSGCLLPLLLALDARLRVETAEGPAEPALIDWLARPVGLMVAIDIPWPDTNAMIFQRKIGLRAAFGPSVIGVAGRIEHVAGTITKARLSVGGGAVRPARLVSVERQLEGEDVGSVDWQAVRSEIEKAVDAPADQHRSAEYRRRAAARALVGGLSGPTKPLFPKKTQRPRPARPPSETILSREAAPDRWHVRPDLPGKISATLAYLTDHRAPAMLVGRIKRAGIAHARILSIDTSAARALPGVVAVITHSDVPGLNAYGIVFQDQPAFCHDVVRHAGDPVAAVAAVDAETAERALALIDVRYEPLPTVTDPLLALDPASPLVHPAGNLVTENRMDRGEPLVGFDRAAFVVEETYVTPRQMHAFMETEGGWAEPTPDGGLAIHAGGQHGGRDQMQIARLLGWSQKRIRVVTSPTGGAFGGKDELTVQPALALLALTAGRPVRLHWSRDELVLAGLKRHPMTIRMRTACDAEGRLLAQEVDALADAGAYASLGPAVIETAMQHACGPYIVDNIKARGRLVYTNNGLCGAFRGFGANQMTYAIECQMDRLAARVGLDPIEIRRRNLRQPGMPGYLGQDVAPSERLGEMLDAAAASGLWQAPIPIDARPDEIIGVGMALNDQGIGLGTIPHDVGAARLTLASDGAIEAHVGLDEIGQGLIPAMQSVVATALGVARRDVRVIYGDTDLAPDSGSTTASRGTFVAWKAADLLAPGFSEALLEAAARRLHQPRGALRLVPGGIGEVGRNRAEPLLTFADLAVGLGDNERPLAETSFAFPKSDYTEGNARFIFAYGATLARIAIDRATGQVRVLDLEVHTAAGPVVDLASYLGQIEGGGVQCLGFTLSEDAIMTDGVFRTGQFDSYMLPTVSDAPARMSVFALEDLDPGDPFGPRGAGEIGIGAVTPAIANAIGDALGLHPSITPLDPEALLDAIDDMGRQK